MVFTKAKPEQGFHKAAAYYQPESSIRHTLSQKD